MTKHREKWFVVSETHVPGLVASREVLLQNGGLGWGEINGFVMSITEHKYRLDENDVLIDLIDIRTRLVVRAADDLSANGRALKFEPLDDTRVSYQKFLFQSRNEE